ncbi:ECF-type sigma factor [Humisphaera borealis]|uniref:Sigma-70 family RNA polymerase sigma factor n=1 Tax=Humisphaera borealis TaxID=2807512 RepID=A0A7M2WPW2_9BACT|nr:ECF-type sigma factor [Humisphaera borealis]QOV87557.1 sigma-70 family RNA polymerase sigma factor [Humisphaera borealis]
MGEHDGESEPQVEGRTSAQYGSELLPLVYDQLRKLARQRMAGERIGHTLQATALVHEAFLRIVGPQSNGSQNTGPKFSNVGHFYRAAAEAMRRILIEHARAHATDKRGGGVHRLSFTTVLDLAAAPDPEEILAFDDALSRLESQAADAAAIVRLRFYAGLSVEETAESLGISPRQVNREWQFARAWLYRELGSPDQP